MTATMMEEHKRQEYLKQRIADGFGDQVCPPGSWILPLWTEISNDSETSPKQ